MADSTPNYSVEQQRLRMNIANLQATIERQRFEILEMEDRKARNEENIEKSLEAIGELEQNLADLVKEYGEGD